MKIVFILVIGPQRAIRAKWTDSNEHVNRIKTWKLNLPFSYDDHADISFEDEIIDIIY